MNAVSPPIGPLTFHPDPDGGHLPEDESASLVDAVLDAHREEGNDPTRVKAVLEEEATLVKDQDVR
jgi:hypothetical protein